MKDPFIDHDPLLISVSYVDVSIQEAAYMHHHPCCPWLSPWWPEPLLCNMRSPLVSCAWVTVLPVHCSMSAWMEAPTVHEMTILASHWKLACSSCWCWNRKWPWKNDTCPWVSCKTPFWMDFVAKETEKFLDAFLQEHVMDQGDTKKEA